jgi:hypothetical protein
MLEHEQQETEKAITTKAAEMAGHNEVKSK